MPSKPDVFRIIIEISSYGMCEIPIWPESSNFSYVKVSSSLVSSSLLWSNSEITWLIHSDRSAAVLVAHNLRA